MTIAAEPSHARLTSVDTMRGIVMVLMALDHVRDFFGVPGISPTNLAAASPGLFLTRWITNFCAPTFFLLMGTGAYLALRKLGTHQLCRYLLTRGLWLVSLELVVMRFILQFNLNYQTTGITVLWALGISMMVLAGLVRLPIGLIGAFGLILIAGHNAFDSIRSSNPLWSILHSPNVIFDRGGHTVLLAYPLIPWIGVTAVGFWMGQIYDWASVKRRKWLVAAGLLAIVVFAVLRSINIYGDPIPRIAFDSTLMTSLSFLNASKYPPSLQFLLMTLGPVLLLLAAIDKKTPAMLRPARVFGQVPLMYYVIHFLLIHAAAVALSLVWNGSAHWLFESPTLNLYPFTPPPKWGLSLPGVYLVWAGVVMAMYPLCRWYATYRKSNPSLWTSYF
jgi:uncharacterized membrane protein